MSDLRISEIMNHLNFDALKAQNTDDPHLFYAQNDPVFASLQKQYLNAKAKYNALDHKNRDAQPMIEMAEWAMQSAESALQTRLIELEADEKLRQAMTQKKAQKTKSFFKIQQQKTLSRQKTVAAGQQGFFFIAMILSLLQDMLDVTHQNFSLAMAFDYANDSEATLKRFS